MLEVILLIQAIVIGLLLAAVGVLLTKLRGKQIDAENFRLAVQQRTEIRNGDMLDLAFSILANQVRPAPNPPSDHAADSVT